MIRLPLAFFVRRLLILPPLVLLLITLSVAYAVPGPALSSYALVSLVFAPLGVWVTVLIGSADSDAHREFTTALTGSRKRTHAYRALAAAIVIAAFSAFCAAVPLMIGSIRVNGDNMAKLPSTLAIIGGGLCVHSACGLIGVGVGTFLHRPILHRTPLSIFFGIGVGIVVPYIPPILSVLRRLNRNDPMTTPLLLIGSTLFVLLATAASSAIADR
jgi:hypothetical protein